MQIDLLRKITSKPRAVHICSLGMSKWILVLLSAFSVVCCWGCYEVCAARQQFRRLDGGEDDE